MADLNLQDVLEDRLRFHLRDDHVCRDELEHAFAERIFMLQDNIGENEMELQERGITISTLTEQVREAERLADSNWREAQQERAGADALRSENTRIAQQWLNVMAKGCLDPAHRERFLSLDEFTERTAPRAVICALCYADLRDRADRLAEATRHLVADAVAVRDGGVRDGLSIQWASIDKTRTALATFEQSRPQTTPGGK